MEPEPKLTASLDSLPHAATGTGKAKPAPPGCWAFGVPVSFEKSADRVKSHDDLRGRRIVTCADTMAAADKWPCCGPEASSSAAAAMYVIEKIGVDRARSNSWRPVVPAPKRASLVTDAESVARKVAQDSLRAYVQMSGSPPFFRKDAKVAGRGEGQRTAGG